MKLLIFALFMLFSLDSIKASKEDVDSLGNRINSLIVKKNINTISEEENKQLLTTIFKIQNSGFKLGFQLEYQSSINELDKAIKLWVSLNDTLSVANLKKFKSIMVAKLGRFSDAETEGREAIELFDKKEHKSGVAASQHSLSIVFDLEQKIDSALCYELKANNFFVAFQDSSRRIGSDTHLINLYRKRGSFSQAKSLQINLDSCKSSFENYATMLMDYYYVSYKLYETIGVKDKSAKYFELYNNEIIGMKTKGNKAGSLYDEM